MKILNILTLQWYLLDEVVAYGMDEVEAYGMDEVEEEEVDAILQYLGASHHDEVDRHVQVYCHHLE
jgi:hypothetical protein